MEAQIQDARDKGSKWFVVFIVMAIVTLTIALISIRTSLEAGKIVLLCGAPVAGIIITLVAFAISMSNFSLVDELETQEHFHIKEVLDDLAKEDGDGTQAIE